MDAIQFLKSEHSRFRKTFASIRGPGRKFDTLLRDLTVHEKMEQKAWYPPLRRALLLAGERNRIISHLLREEKDAAKAIRQFKQVRSLEAWWEKYRKFKKDVLHHASEEERDLFPLARQVMSKTGLLILARNMKEFKRRQLR